MTKMNAEEKLMALEEAQEKLEEAIGLLEGIDDPRLETYTIPSLRDWICSDYQTGNLQELIEEANEEWEHEEEEYNKRGEIEEQAEQRARWETVEVIEMDPSHPDYDPKEGPEVRQRRVR